MQPQALKTALEEHWSVEKAGENPTTFAELLDPQVVWHDSLVPDRDLQGQGQAQAVRATLHHAFPDMALTVDSVHQAEQGHVLIYWHATGTYQAELSTDLPASGQKVSWEGSFVLRYGGGQDQGVARVVEVWCSWDPLLLYRQLGWTVELSEDAKPAIEDAKPEAEDAKLAAEDAKLAAEDAKLAAEDAKPEAEDAKLAAEDAKPEAEDAKPEAEDAKPEAEDAKVAAEAATVPAPNVDGEADEAGQGKRKREEDTDAEEQQAPKQSNTSEDPPGTASLEAQQAANRSVVEKYFYVYNTGKFEILKEIVHPGYHYAGLLDLGSMRGEDAMRAMMSGWRDALPDLDIGHEFFLAVEDDKVMFRWVIKGTHTSPAPLLSVPTTGKRVLVKGVTTLTLSEGRICKKVSHANGAYTLHQLGRCVPQVQLQAQ